MSHPLPVPNDTPPSEYHHHVSVLLDSAFDRVEGISDLITKKHILAEYRHFAATNPAAAEFYLAIFAQATATRMTAVLPIIARHVQRSEKRNHEGFTVVMVPLDVLVEGVRFWVLNDDESEAMRA